MDDSDPRLAEALEASRGDHGAGRRRACEATQLTPHTFLFRDQPPFMQRVNVVLDEYLAAERASSSAPGPFARSWCDGTDRAIASVIASAAVF